MFFIVSQETRQIWPLLHIVWFPRFNGNLGQPSANKMINVAQFGVMSISKHFCTDYELIFKVFFVSIEWKNVLLNLLPRGENIAKLTDITYDESGQVMSPADKSAMVRAARGLLSAVTRVLLLADRVVIKQIQAAKLKVSNGQTC